MLCHYFRDHAPRQTRSLTLKFLRWFKRIVLSLVLLVIGAMVLRLYDIQRGPDLQLWHTYVPHEMDADEIDKAD